MYLLLLLHIWLPLPCLTKSFRFSIQFNSWSKRDWNINFPEGSFYPCLVATTLGWHTLLPCVHFLLFFFSAGGGSPPLMMTNGLMEQLDSSGSSSSGPASGPPPTILFSTNGENGFHLGSSSSSSASDKRFRSLPTRHQGGNKDAANGNLLNKSATATGVTSCVSGGGGLQPQTGERAMLTMNNNNANSSSSSRQPPTGHNNFEDLYAKVRRRPQWPFYQALRYGLSLWNNLHGWPDYFWHQNKLPANILELTKGRSLDVEKRMQFMHALVRMRVQEEPRDQGFFLPAEYQVHKKIVPDFPFTFSLLECSLLSCLTKSTQHFA